MPALRWLDENIEKIIILVNYLAMAAIIFVEVIRRFLFNEQAAWSSTVPIYLFLWICWIGCAYNVKIRAHLKFDELRSRMGTKAQLACLMLDAILWIVFSLIVIWYSWEQVIIARDNFAIVQGTDNVLQWWFYLATPLAFILLVFRVLQNVQHDLMAFRKGEELQIKSNIFGE